MLPAVGMALLEQCLGAPLQAASLIAFAGPIPGQPGLGKLCWEFIPSEALSPPLWQVDKPAGGDGNLHASVRWDKLTDTWTHAQSHSLFSLPFSCAHSSSIYRVKPIRTGFPSPSPHKADSALILYILSSFSPQREKLCLCIFLLQPFIPCTQDNDKWHHTGETETQWLFH